MRALTARSRKKALIAGIILLFLFFARGRIMAADMEAILDDAAGTSSFSVKDSSSVTMASFDSDGNAVIKGGLRLDASGVEATTAENLIVDGKIGVANTNPSSLLQLGTSGTTLGTMGLAGSTSGVVTVQPAAAAGTWSLTLPTSAGSANQVLSTDGTGVTSWAQAGYRTLVTLGSDVASSASTSFQNITGLSFDVSSGTNYRFYALIFYTCSATTIGMRVSLTAPARTYLGYTTRVGTSVTGGTSEEFQNHQTATDTGTTSTASPATAGNVMVLEGFIRPSADGTVQLRFAPETATANGIVIRAGSTLEWW